MKTNEELKGPLNGADASQEAMPDGGLFMQVGRRRRRLWMVAGACVFLVSLVVALFLVPQTYSATVSMSMQKPDTAASPLMVLSGGGAKKYLGVIRSRTMAERVDTVAHFRRAMGLPDSTRDQEDAIDRVIKDLKIEDNATDGLLYVTVNLAGPPALGLDPGGKRRSDVRATVTIAANAYSAALQDYLKNTDTDKELSLLRAADGQVHQAQVAYAAAIDEFGSFISHTKMRSVPSSGPSPAGATDALTSGTQLSSLYLRKAELEAKMKSTEAMSSAIRNLLQDKQQVLAGMPDEDPLLLTARRQVNEAAANLETLQVTFGSSMQSVKRAKARLELAEARLHTEVETILKGKTSDELKHEALQAEYETVERQIRLAERDFQFNRNMSVEMEKRRNNVTLKLETLKTILTRYAELKLQTVSAQNRMVVVDRARPPRSGKPGMLLLCAVSLFFPLVLIGLWWIVEFLLLTQPGTRR